MFFKIASRKALFIWENIFRREASSQYSFMAQNIFSLFIFFSYFENQALGKSPWKNGSDLLICHLPRLNMSLQIKRCASDIYSFLVKLAISHISELSLAILVSCRFAWGGAGVSFQSVFPCVSVGLPSHPSTGDSSSV